MFESSGNCFVLFAKVIFKPKSTSSLRSTNGQLPIHVLKLVIIGNLLIENSH